MLACGTPEVKDLNLLDLIKSKIINFLTNAAKKGFFVKFKKGVDSLTVLIMSGTLYVESFLINNGYIYVLGNDNNMGHAQNIVNYERAYIKYNIKL